MRGVWELTYLGLGSNVGDRAAHLEAAVERLGRTPGLRVLRRSSLYETQPVGYADQPWFLNAVVEGETCLGAEGLLRRLKAMEAELGRQPGLRWGPRSIDIDILLYGQRALATPELHLPHREMWNRLFVLVPLAELAPRLRAPDGLTISERIAALDQQRAGQSEAAVRRWQEMP